MNYEQAAQKHNEIEAEIARINLAAKKQVAELNKIKADIESWFAIKAKEDGLKNINTAVGTVYWSTHSSASVAEPSVFKQFVINNQAWDLLETRASKTAVQSYIKGHGEAPPGVNFSTISVFNLRKTSPKE